MSWFRGGLGVFLMNFCLITMKYRAVGLWHSQSCAQWAEPVLQGCNADRHQVVTVILWLENQCKATKLSAQSHSVERG